MQSPATSLSRRNPLEAEAREITNRFRTILILIVGHERG